MFPSSAFRSSFWCTIQGTASLKWKLEEFPDRCKAILSYPLSVMILPDEHEIRHGNCQGLFQETINFANSKFDEGDVIEI